MKKKILQYSSYIEPVIIITSFLVAMLIESRDNSLLKWFPLSLLWGIALWYLQKPNSFYSIIKDRAFIVYLIFICWAIFSSFFLSTVKAISTVALIPFVGGLLSYLIGFNGNDKKETLFDHLLLILGILLTIYTCYQKFTLGISRPTGLLANWNSHAAVLAMIIIPWVLRYSLKPFKSTLQLTYITLLSFIFAFAMGLTLSRGTLIIIVVSIFSLLWFFWQKRLFYKHALVLFTAIILGYIFTSFFITDSIVQRLQNASQVDSLTALGSGRHLLWLPAWAMYLDHPFFGWGLGTFHLLYPQYKPPLSAELGHFTHNDYLQFLLELGPIGLCIFLAFVFILLKRLYQLITHPSTKLSPQKIEAFILLSTCVAMLVHTFFTFNLYQLSIQIIWGYYLGRASRHLFFDQHTSKPLIKQKTYKFIYRSFATIVILLITCFGFSFYFLDKAELIQNQKKKLDLYWKAVIFFPLIDHYETLSASLLTNRINKLPPQQREKLKIIALSEVNIAITKMPFNTINYLTKANILKTMQKDKTIIYDQYEKALKLNPTLIKVRYQYANYLIENKKHEKALSILWNAWDRVNAAYYETGVQFLKYHLEVNNHYGDKQNSLMIKHEIERIAKLKKIVAGGLYVFNKQK